MNGNNINESNIMKGVVQHKLRAKRPKEGMVEKQSVSGLIADIIIYLLLAGVIFCCIIPLWHVAMSSISDGKALLAHGGLLWLPAGNPTLEGFRLLFKDASIMKGYANTLLYVTSATLLGLFINATGGYVLSRSSKLKPLLMMLVMFTMLFNGGLIPSYMVNKALHLVGTRWALIIPGCTNAFFMVLMMNAFRGVPESTVESARIDGAGHLRVLFQVMLPQCKTLTTVTVLNSVILQWNAWFAASIYVPNKRDLWPLQLWIRQIVADNQGLLMSSNPDYNRYLIQYAVIIAATLPILCAFPFFQKRMEAGVIGGAVKE